MERMQELLQNTGPAVRKSGSDCTLLHAAAAHCQLDMLLFLLKLINPNVVNKEGQTPAHLAAMRGHTQVLRILLADEELSLDKRDNSQRTFRHLVSSKHSSSTKRFLRLCLNIRYYNFVVLITLFFRDSRKLSVNPSLFFFSAVCTIIRGGTGW